MYEYISPIFSVNWTSGDSLYSSRLFRMFFYSSRSRMNRIYGNLLDFPQSGGLFQEDMCEYWRKSDYSGY